VTREKKHFGGVSHEKRQLTCRKRTKSEGVVRNHKFSRKEWFWPGIGREEGRSNPPGDKGDAPDQKEGDVGPGKDGISGQGAKKEEIASSTRGDKIRVKLSPPRRRQGADPEGISRRAATCI